MKSSMDVRLLRASFSLAIQGVSASNYTWKYEQSSNLTNLKFIIDYKESIANKQIFLSYSSARRRLLAEVEIE